MKPVRHIALFLSSLVVLSQPLHSQQPDAPAQRQPATAVVVDEVVVTAQGEGYQAPLDAITALKTATPLLETPQAVSVVGRQLIEDQGARKIEDVLRNIAGISTGGYFQDWDYYRIRGFDASFNSSYVDGLLTEASPGEELWGADRVEVIKGPASTLYGQGPLGGLVNTVSKHPKPEFGGEIRLSGGAWDFYEAALDINGPLLSPDGKAPAASSAKGAKNVVSQTISGSGLGIYARLNALYKNSGSFTDYSGSERIFIAPSVTFQFGDDTSLTLLTSYRDDKSDLSFALPARGTVLPSRYGQIPVSRYVGNPGLGNNEWERTIRLGYEFKHKFSDHLSLRNNFRYYMLDWTSHHLSYPNDLDGRMLGLSGFYASGANQGLRVDAALDAQFDTGSIAHTLTAGIDYRWSESEYTAQDSVEWMYFDVFRPNYARMVPYVYGPSYGSKESDDDLGFYVQEHAKFGDFSLTLGGRFDMPSFDSGAATYDDSAFTPKVGLTYEVATGTALYANYSRSYNPQWYSVDGTGAPVGPEEGVNWETGIKYSLFDNKLTGLLAVYQLTRENVATPNFATPDPFDSVITGEQRSRGFELETAARLAPGLELTTAYTYIDAEVTKDNVYTPGTRLQGVPDHTVNAWLKYIIQSGPLKGFGIGLGGRYMTSQAGDLADSFSLPGYGIVDAALYYERDKLSVQVNFNNVLDKRHFVGSYDELYVLPGAPFNVTASVSWKF